MPNQLRLYEGQPGTTESLLYTAPVGREVDVTEVIATNVTGTAATFSLSIVPVAGTAGPTNRIFQAQSVAANTEQRFPLDEELSPGDFLSGLQGTASAITLLIAGNPMEPS